MILDDGAFDFICQVLNYPYSLKKLYKKVEIE